MTGSEKNKSDQQALIKRSISQRDNAAAYITVINIVMLL